MKAADFDYVLPVELVAQNPLEDRDSSRLMVLDRSCEEISDKRFYDLVNTLSEDDVLVFNQSKVIPARIKFSIDSKECEVFLVKELGDFRWEALVRPGKRFRVGDEVVIDDQCRVKVMDVLESGVRVLDFIFNGSVDEFRRYLEEKGEMPLPPYINESSADFSQYQTVYAKDAGSVAAPTAGLHFTDSLLEKLKAKGVNMEFVTLHVGLGTFMPVKADDVMEHKMHSEFYELSGDVAERLNSFKGAGKRIICVGTTSVRVLESCSKDGRLVASSGETDIFIYPGYEWRFVDGLITNFHLPKSTLLMLVSAFAGSGFVKKAYERAIDLKYRFYSFGDAMLIL